MIILRIPAMMKYYSENQSEIIVNGATISDVLEDIINRYPALKFHIFDHKGNVRRHINLFLNGNNIKDLDGLNTQLTENDKIILLPSISGG